MTKASPPILNLNGYTDLPPGKVATVVTYLEMRKEPKPRRGRAKRAEPRASWRLDVIRDTTRYRRLFRQVGEPWLWFSRLVMPEEMLAAIIGDPMVEVYALCDLSGDIGLLELDFRTKGECELAFFGLVPEAIGQGAGRYLMDFAIKRAFSQRIKRFFVHTCSLDHPKALLFYVHSGFAPYKQAIEVADDPRLSRHLPLGAAPHVPVLGRLTMGKGRAADSAP